MFVCFFFNDTATTEIYTLSLHDALPIFDALVRRAEALTVGPGLDEATQMGPLIDDELRERVDRKSTRLNSSHANISYAVFCLKKKKEKYPTHNVDDNSHLTFCTRCSKYQ